MQDKKYGKGTYIWNDGQVYKETLEDENVNDLNNLGQQYQESIEGLSIE